LGVKSKTLQKGISLTGSSKSCRALRLLELQACAAQIDFVSEAELFRRGEPHAPQGCVKHIQLDADDYPGGDPQNGQ
jgi:hypothetical protein